MQAIQQGLIDDVTTIRTEPCIRECSKHSHTQTQKCVQQSNGTPYASGAASIKRIR